MTGPQPADLRAFEAMVTELQRQVDELAGQLAALSNVVHAHTLATLAPGAPGHSTRGDGHAKAR